MSNYLQTALSVGYQLDDLVPLIPANGTLKPGARYQDGTLNPALDPADVAMGKQPGTYLNAGYWVRRKGWNSTSIAQEDVLLHDSVGCNVGLKQGVRLVSLDVDVTDEAVMSVLRPAIPYKAIRGGKRPKALWMFRVIGDPIPHRSVPLSNGNLIEVLGVTSTGNPQQSAVLGMHPCGTFYAWEGYTAGLLPPYADLPTIDAAGMDQLVELAVGIAEQQGLTRIDFTARSGGGTGETSKMGLTAEPELVAKVMEATPNNLDWKGWKDRGIALFNAVGPEVGWPIWDAWSRKSPRYDPEYTELTWCKGMWPNNQSSGFGSLVEKARADVGGRLSDDIEATLVGRRIEHVMPMSAPMSAPAPLPMSAPLSDEQVRNTQSAGIKQKLMALVTADAVEAELVMEEIVSTTGVNKTALKADLKKMKGQMQSAQAAVEYLSINQMIEQWFAGCVYVVKLNRMFSMQYGLLNRDRVNAVLGGRKFQISPDGAVTTEAWKAFTQNRAYRFPTVTGTTFRPDHAYGAIVE